MELKDIRSGIKDLIEDALQDFMALVVEDKWQEKLYAMAKSAVTNNDRRAKFKDVYIVLDKIDDKTKFTTKHMDTSLIVEVTYYDDLGNKNKRNKKDKFVEINPKTQIAIYNLSQARNDLSHKTRHESPQKLYENGLVALRFLNDFIETVDCFELSIDEHKRNTFKKKYEKPTEKLRELLEDTHTKIKQDEKIKKDIQHILDSSDRDQAWSKISGPYYSNWNPPMGEEEFNTFITEAAKTGIVQAYSSAADYYYFKAKDYDMAEMYLSYLYQNRKNKQYNKDSMLQLANIYLNKLSEHAGDDKAIVEMLIADGHNIEKTDDGKKYVFVYKNDINDDSVKESFSQVRSSMDDVLRILNEAKASSKGMNSKINDEKTTDSSNLKQSRKSGLTVGGVSGSKKMRLGRVQTKKSNPDSTTKQSKKTSQTAEELPDSKKMRLGRVHKKKPNSSSSEQNDS